MVKAHDLLQVAHGDVVRVRLPYSEELGDVTGICADIGALAVVASTPKPRNRYAMELRWFGGQVTAYTSHLLYAYMFEKVDPDAS